MGGETTRDPGCHRAADDGAAELRIELEVLFASELDLVGHRADLGPAGRSFVGKIIGREDPEVSLRGRRRPLGDPCISRRQLRVSWDAPSRVFRVEPEPGSRRELSQLTVAGLPMPDGVPGDRVVSIGDRACLLFAVRRPEQPSPSVLMGASDAMRALRSRVDEVARQTEVALVTGPTGSGKELVARELHARSGRRGPFVAVNSAALPAELVESELFGHARGAFSGATTAKAGLFQAARDGTLFLDEVGELPLAMQAKLLRAIELRKVRPVGGASEEDVEVRIVAATHRDLEDDVVRGLFRADFFQRLRGLRIDVPPLADHRDDLGRLFVTFLRRHLAAEDDARFFRAATVDAPPLPHATFISLLRHSFPGNVRELDRCALDVATRGPGAAPSWTAAAASEPAPAATATARPRPSRDELAAALARADHVQHRVARELGVPYATLDRWLRDAGIRRPRDLTADEVRRELSASGSIEAAARSLGVSVRGLKLRLAELGI